jgi:hypothetical protein
VDYLVAASRMQEFGEVGPLCPAARILFLENGSDGKVPKGWTDKGSAVARQHKHQAVPPS